MNKAILVIRIEQEESLPLNEFFDYNGYCYALTCKREHMDEVAIDLEDFYEETVGTSEMEGVDVYFVKTSGAHPLLYGWYQNAKVYRRIKHPTLFLEGNVLARASEVVQVEKPIELSGFEWYVGNQVYEVIEIEDVRHSLLEKKREYYRGKNIFQRFPYIHIAIDQGIAKSYESCIWHCEQLAGAIMQDSCSGIAELAELRAYAKLATERNGKDADGFYYLAMSCYQLGFQKEAMKAIEKALRIEPDTAEFVAQKAGILVSMGYIDSAKELFQRAYELSGDEDYLLI